VGVRKGEQRKTKGLYTLGCARTIWSCACMPAQKSAQTWTRFQCLHVMSTTNDNKWDTSTRQQRTTTTSQRPVTTRQQRTTTTRTSTREEGRDDEHKSWVRWRDSVGTGPKRRDTSFGLRYVFYLSFSYLYTLLNLKYLIAWRNFYNTTGWAHI
jgi:hypothetical protein